VSWAFVLASIRLTEFISHPKARSTPKKLVVSVNVYPRLKQCIPWVQML
jgi:hypothetical protein